MFFTANTVPGTYFIVYQKLHSSTNEMPCVMNCEQLTSQDSMPNRGATIDKKAEYVTEIYLALL